MMNYLRKVIDYLKTIPPESRYMIVSAGIGIAVVSLTIWYKKKYYLPKKWLKVGEVSDLMCFPVKSCAVVRENEFECNYLGLQKRMLKDRRFMVIDLNGQFITGNEQPRLVKVTPFISGNILTLTAPGMMDHLLDIEDLEYKGTIKATLWGEKVPTVDCGEEVAKWFSRFLLSEDTGLRLVYFPYDTTTRDVRKQNNKVFKRLCKSDSGALHDTTHFSLIAESSVVDLNTRLERPVTPQHFRPNFVVKGTQAYEEDTWNYIKIGKMAVFQNVKPNIRRNSITVDPETGVKDLKLEPLKTLKEYRQIYEPEIRPYVGECPVMGINLGMRAPGVVKLGDPVYVAVE